jgi:hypothetical protein
MKNSSLIALVTGLALIIADGASAQTAEPSRVFLNVNAGGQMQSHSLTSSETFPIYLQTASANTAQTIETGPFFDMSVGAQVWSELGVAIGFSSFKNSSDIVGTASIPHPFFFDSAATVEFTAGADHRERNIYVVALWFVPVTERIDVAFSAGPSFTRVEQGVLAAIEVPPGTQDAIPVVQSEEGWAKGVNVGFDATYLLTPRYALFGGTGVRVGLGGFIRYNGSSVTLPSGAEVDAGGFQGGAGLRFRF